MLRELFTEVFQTYLRSKDDYNSRAGGAVRKLSEMRIFQLFRHAIPEVLYDQLSLDKNRYELKGSVGQGEITEVPWVCLFDVHITTSPGNGYFIAFLFDAQMQRVYLTLMQGWTQYEKALGQTAGMTRIIQNTQFAQQQLRSTEGFSKEGVVLNAKKLGPKYEAGVICSKAYDRSDLPGDQQIIEDVRNLMGVYRELKGWIGNNILEIEHAADDFQIRDTEAIDAPRISRQSPGFQNLFTMPAFSGFNSEFMGTYIQQTQQATRNVHRSHGRVVESLRLYFDEKGYSVFNDQNRDLVVEDPRTGAIHLFEVKTPNNTQSLYTAIGQLIFYGAPFKNNGQAVGLTLVSQLEEFQMLDDFLATYNIRVIRYHWENNIPIFRNLDPY